MHFDIDDRVSLRGFRPEDRQDLVNGLNDWAVTRWLGRVPHPYRLDHADAFIARDVDQVTIVEVLPMIGEGDTHLRLSTGDFFRLPAGHEHPKLEALYPRRSRMGAGLSRLENVRWLVSSRSGLPLSALQLASGSPLRHLAMPWRG